MTRRQSFSKLIDRSAQVVKPGEHRSPQMGRASGVVVFGVFGDFVFIVFYFAKISAYQPRYTDHYLEKLGML